MHPISRPRLETHFAVIRLKELPGGFRVLSAYSVSIESLPDKQAQQDVRDNVLSLRTNRPGKVCGLAMYDVEAIDPANSFCMCEGYVFGDYSHLAAIQKKASIENGRQVYLIKMLNKESSKESDLS
jgi:hypothetical protein